MSKNKSLPVLGVGPMYFIFCLIITVTAILLSEKSFLKNGDLSGLESIAIIVGIAFILIGVLLWISAVILQKISEKIKQGKLVTEGVYSIVRNPIYSAIFLVFTGILILRHNGYLLIPPLIFYIFLTVLMKWTEEKWLLEKFGKEYEEYCKKVNRMIPWWRKK